MTHDLRPDRPFYLQFLNAEFERRIQRNPRYSLRAFALFLRLDPSCLSRVLSGKQKLSAKAVLAILLKLGLQTEERELFIRSYIDDRVKRDYALLLTMAESEPRQPVRAA